MTRRRHRAAARHRQPRGSPSPPSGFPSRIVLIAVGVLFLVLFLLLPLAAVFVEAFRAGLGAYFAAITEPDALAAIRLTLLVAAIAVPANVSSASPRPGPSPSSTSPARAS